MERLEVGRIPGGLLGYLQMAQASIGRFNAEVLVTTSQEERVSFCSSFYSSDLAQDFPTKDLGSCLGMRCNECNLHPFDAFFNHLKKAGN